MKDTTFIKDDKSNIVENKEKLYWFRSILNEEFTLLNKSKSFQQETNMEYIIREINLLKISFLNRFESKYQEIIMRNLDKFYGPFFNYFNDYNQLFNYLYQNSDELFYLKKIYQLSHSFGILDDDDDGGIKKYMHIEINNFLKMLLYLDSFETFPRFLEPVIKLFWHIESKHIWRGKYSTREYYNYINEIIPSFSIDRNEMDKFFFTLRNEVAHSSILFFEKEINFIKHIDTEDTRKRKALVEIPLDEIFTKINFFLNLVIIYSTEFDLRLLKLYSSQQNIYNSWMRYFKIYIEAWQKIGTVPESKDD